MKLASARMFTWPWALVAILLLATVIVPPLARRQVLFRAGLHLLPRDERGRFVLEEVSLEAGERYTIYLDRPSWGLPAFSSSSSSRFRPSVHLIDAVGTTISNTMTWETIYRTPTTEAEKVAEFQARQSGPQRLSLHFDKPPSRPLASYEMVVRPHRWSHLLLLLLSDWTNVLVIAAVVVWTKLRE